MQYVISLYMFHVMFHIGRRSKKSPHFWGNSWRIRSLNILGCQICQPIVIYHPQIASNKGGGEKEKRGKKNESDGDNHQISP